YRRYEAALSGFNARVFYSVKANSNQAVIALLGKLGAGADVVSVGEMYRALKAGIAAKDIVFAGVGKTRDEMAAALDAGIHQFNVESHGELYALNDLAVARSKRAPVALRINPDVDALTHAKISTGKAENKFGIDLAHAPQVYAEAAKLPGIDIMGLACHIGSQLLDVAPYRSAFGKLADLTRALRATGLKVQRIDLGGGVGVAYKSEQTISIDGYVEAVASTVGNLGCQLEIEPGRSIVAESGLLLARVINVKSGVSRKFVIVDAAMNDLIRPALYDAYHEIVPVTAPASDAPVERVDIVGPICETGDRFAEQRPLLGETVAGLADRSHHIHALDRGVACRLLDGHDFVIGVVERRADEVVHRRIHDDEFSADARLHVDDAGQQHPGIADDAATGLQLQGA